MSRGLSLYLDLLRFFMAVLVWVGHSTFHGFTGHPFLFWRTYAFGPTAVTGFFVLSGFVIAHVTSGREKDPRAYAVSRVARLYSVVIPALLLTYTCDSLGLLVDPDYAHAAPAPLSDLQPLRYLLSALMIQDFWIFPARMFPGTNGPFWSLSYEITYYICFGLFMLPGRWIGIIGSATALLLAGPRIAAAFPIWLLGVVVYHWQRRVILPRWIAMSLVVLSVSLLLMVGSLRLDGAYETAHAVQLNFMEGGLFAVHIAAATSLLAGWSRWPAWIEPPIRWLGSLSFPIYLCHVPLLSVLTAYAAGTPGTWLQHLWLFGGSAVVIAAVGRIGDWLRDLIRSAARRSFTTA